MFTHFRRIHKLKCVQLLTTGLVLCMMMLSWEELDHHVVSHMRSYTYRYLINSYEFINSSFNIASNHHYGQDSAEGTLGKYPYLINHPDKCKGEDVLLLLFVKTSPENSERRQAIRSTWGNESFLLSELRANVKVVFVLGTHPDGQQRSKVQTALQQENHDYGDLIQQDFVDTFHNLTAKLILQFQWGHENCPQARFLMSADDDIFVHMPNLLRYLRKLLDNQSEATHLWAGHVHTGAPPNRRKDSKYYVPYDLYPWTSYPDYTSGAAYVVSGDVAAKIYHATLVLNSTMYIDDVYMGICAKAVGISPKDQVHFSGEGKAPDHYCIYDHMITSHGHATDIRSIWQAANNAKVKKRGFLDNLYCTVVRVMLLCLPHQQKTYSCMAAFT